MIYKTIEELTTVVTGGTPSTSKAEYWENGNIPWLQSGCCQNCDVYQADKFISQSGYDNSSTQVMPVNTVMIALTGATAGKVGYLNVEACGNQSITGIFPCEELNPRFLFYFLISQRRKILVDCVGGAQAHISQGYVKKIKVPVYSKSIQERIVNIMNICSKNIKHYEMILKEYDVLVKARFIEMFGDPVLNERKFPTLSGADFFKLSNGRAVPDEKRIETGIPAYGGNGISWYTDEFLMAEDTIVVGRVGFQSGNVHYVIGPLWITDNAMYISQYDKDKFNLRFLCELMQHVNFSRFQDAGDLKKITQKPFMTFKYILPSMDLQHKFVNFKIEVDKSREEVKKSLEKTQQLYDSLMQEYFG